MITLDGNARLKLIRCAKQIAVSIRRKSGLSDDCVRGTVVGQFSDHLGVLGAVERAEVLGLLRCAVADALADPRGHDPVPGLRDEIEADYDVEMAAAVEAWERGVTSTTSMIVQAGA